MAKKNVIIFDGEDKFINPKKAVYSKTRGQSKNANSFVSARGDEEGEEDGPRLLTRNYGEQVQDGNENANQDYSQQVQYRNETNVGPASPVIDDYSPVVQTPSFQAPVIDSPAELLNRFTPAPSVEDDRKSTMPIYEAPVQAVFQPITQEPPYVAPTPQLPSNPYYDDRKTIMPIYEAPPQYVSQPITQEPPAYAAPIYEDERRIITPAFPSFPINETPVPIYNAPTPELPSNPYLDDRKTIMPIYEAPPISISRPITEEPPSYVAPRLDDVYDGRRPPRFDDPANPPSLDARNPIYYAPVPPSNDGPDKSCPEGMRLFNGTCIPINDDFVPRRGIPDERYPINGGNPYQPNPIYTAPVPPLPPRGRIIEDPMGGGGSPVMGGPEIPRPNCPTGFIFNETTGICTPKPMLERDPILTPSNTTSSTTSTTTKAAAAVPTTTSSSTTTTTVAVVDKICNPPIYAAPKYYKWVSKGNCAYELVVDDTQLKDAAPAPVLPSTGQPIININIPTGTTGGGLGTIPTTSTTVQTTTKSLLPKGEDSGGSGGGGGGGSPFPEEPAPTGPAPKKNYFWWYVGGALAIYLLMKRKNKE